MVEVDPAILIAGSTAIATLVGVVVCMRSGGGEKPKQLSAPKATKTAAPKAKKAAKAPKQPEIKVEKKVEKKETAPPAKAKVTKKTEEIPSPKQTSVVAEEEPKTNKKAKETPEQRAARLERQKIAKQKKADEQAAAIEVKEVTAPLVNNQVIDSQYSVTSQQPLISDGWAVVEDRRKKKVKHVEVKAPVAATEEGTTVQAASAFVTEQVMVDSKKIGGIIGPKGTTLHAIQDMTDVTINTPKDRDGAPQAAVSVTGTPEGVFAAIKIIRELNSKGYSKALEGDNFNESAITVKYTCLSDLIGKNGSCIRAIQDKTGVKISIPPANDAKTKVRIGLAGSPEGITEAKGIMQEIMTYFHSEVTHPGVIHVGMDVPERMFNVIIGSKGAEIKHIQNNFKVNVHIPSSDSESKEVLVIGLKNAVDGATKYIEKIVSNLIQEEAQANSIAETWNEQQAPEEPTSEEGDAPWMDQYSYNREQKVSLISKDGADVLQKAQTNAWKESTSAEGW